MKETIELAGCVYDNGVLIRERFGLSNATMSRWTQAGILPPPIRFGRSLYYPRHLVDERLRAYAEERGMPME